MIDLHCHLDLYPNALSLLPVVAARNLFTLVVTTSPRAWQATSRLFAGHESVKVAVGLHPEIADKKAGERELLISCIEKSPFIGEVGLDGSARYQPTLPLQESILRDALVECERVGGRVLSIHSRNASGRVLDLLEECCRTSLPVLHWVSGSAKEARRGVDLGCWFSVGPAMLRSAKGRALLQELPMERVLPETDGPYVQEGSEPLMPWQAIRIADFLVPVWTRTKEEVHLQFRRNLSALLDHIRP